MYVILLMSALVVGGLLATQTSVNQQLNRAIGTPYGASTLQLAVAAIALAVLAVATGGLGAASSLSGVTPWWLLLGGIASPIYITAGILLVPRLGALVAVGLFVTGQMLVSLALDLTGAFEVPTRPWSPGITLGVLAVLAGITAVIGGQGAGGLPRRTDGARGGGPGTVSRTELAAPSRAAGRAGWIVLGLVAGAVLPLQGAINARLRAQIADPLAVSTVSFTVATLTIAVVLAGLLALHRTPTPRAAALRTMPWWGWLGGLCAAVYVTATFLLIPAIGPP